MEVSARSGFRDSPGVAPARPWALRICGVLLLGMIMFCLVGCSGERGATPSGGGGPSASGGDMPDGVSFRDIAWGTDISQMPDMSETEGGSWPGLRYYSRQGDRLAFGGASLASLKYAAFNDRFFRVDFEAVPGQALKLSQTLATEYGQPRRNEGTMNEWAVKTPKGETVEITFDTEDSIGWIIFQPIEDELLRDMENPLP